MSQLILLDPGHRNNTKDFGASGINGEKESEYALMLAQRIGHYLRSYGKKVEFTRTSEEQTITLNRREKLISELKPDIVISVHFNAWHLEGANGGEVFYNPNNRNTPISWVRNIQKAIVRSGVRDRGVKTNSSWTMLTASMQSKAVLIEPAFMSNENNLRLIRDKYWRERLANFLARAIID